MASVNELRLKRAWFGPIAYVFSAFVTSAINLGTFVRLEGSVSKSLNADLKGVLAAFTAISLLAFALQFIYARTIGVGRRASWNMGFTTASVTAGGICVFTAITVDSSLDFRIISGFWVGLATLSALLPSGLLASHLVNEKWRPICLFVLSSSCFRLALWEIPSASRSISSILASLTLSQILAFLLLLLMSETRDYEKCTDFKIRQQKVPAGILLGLALVVVLGSTGRKSALGDSAIEFAEVSLVGRNIFFVAAIFAYASFPFLTTHELFSRELGKRFRQAETLVVLATLTMGSLILINRYVAEDIFGLNTNVDKFLILITIFSWSLLAISLIPVLYYVAHNSRLGLATACPAIAMLLAQFSTSTARSLALVFLFSNIFLLGISLIPALLRNKPILRAEIAKHEDLTSIHGEQVTIIVPSHNSGQLGIRTVLNIHDCFVKQGIDVRVIAVSDGSTDESVELFNSLSYEWFQHIQLVENQGKGGALKTGFAQSNSGITGFIDADGDIPAHLLIPMYRELIQRDADVVFGSKWHPESKVQVTGGRRLLSRFHHVIQKMLFKLDIDDTQVGIKLYKTQNLKDVLPTLREDGFSLDVEIFIALGAYGHNNFVEMPVEIDRQGSSTISVRNVIMSFIDLLRIFWRARVSLNYEGRAYLSKIELQVRDS